MTVVYEGIAHSVTVSPGPEGEAAFMRDVRRIYGLKVSLLLLRAAAPLQGALARRWLRRCRRRRRGF